MGIAYDFNFPNINQGNFSFPLKFTELYEASGTQELFIEGFFEIQAPQGVSVTFDFPDPITATVEAIPEPASSLSILALGTLGAASTLKRKLKPSKLSEKETTKVS